MNYHFEIQYNNSQTVIPFYQLYDRLEEEKCSVSEEVCDREQDALHSASLGVLA